MGTTVGGNKLERCGSKRSVIDSFKALYAEKTNNEWENRDSFKKFPNKFYPLDIDYGQVGQDIAIFTLSIGRGSLGKQFKLRSDAAECSI